MADCNNVDYQIKVIKACEQLSMATAMSMSDAMGAIVSLQMRGLGEPPKQKRIIICNHCRTEYDDSRKENCMNCGAPTTTVK